MTIRQNLYIQQGATWSYTYTHKDSAGVAIDLTNYSAAMSIKKVPGQTTTPVAYLSSGADADGGTITLGGALGTVTLSMTSTETAALLTDVDIFALIPTEKREKYVGRKECYIYDLSLTDGSGNVSRVLEGEVEIARSVTP